uniref:Uncharacterized protein n=1 Tax=Romanomermis culicivorax TaxID=13658 RepID=A0A915K0T8_ROMCU
MHLNGCLFKNLMKEAKEKRLQSRRIHTSSGISEKSLFLEFSSGKSSGNPAPDDELMNVCYGLKHTYDSSKQFDQRYVYEIKNTAPAIIYETYIVEKILADKGIKPAMVLECSTSNSLVCSIQCNNRIQETL